MLYHDILDYNSKFEYKVTRKGKNLLKKVSKVK
jgi:predicted transcriptional regulator